jgi:sulfite exporter TauE/SafE
MDQALIVSAMLMGLAGTPHCLAMCGASCTASCGDASIRALLPFHAGRIVAYSAAGAVAAGSVGSLAALGQMVAALRPLWTLVHMAALALGLFLVWQGRQPACMEKLGRSRSLAAKKSGTEQGWQAVMMPMRRAGLGLAWVAWPCGLLQSALLVAALANSPWAGALVMTGFAATSAAGLVLGPAVWLRFAARRDGGAVGLTPAVAVRLAGAALAAASAWALGHGLWMRVAAWCMS